MRIRPIEAAAALLAVGLLPRPVLPAAAPAPTASSRAALPAQAEARAAVRELLRPEARQGFDVHACPRIPPAAWGRLALTGEPIRQKYAFAPGCDVQGTVTLTRGESPVDLELRHLKDLRRLQASLTAAFAPDWMNRTVKVTILARQGTATRPSGREPLGFAGDYAVVLGLDGSVRENRGGELRVTRLGRRAVDVREPLRFTR
jgi:hypothetical protein